MRTKYIINIYNIINTTDTIMLQNTETALRLTGIQYTVTILGNQGRCLS